MNFASILLVHYSQTDPDNSNSRFEMLKKCIQSLKENTDYPAEILVWDNGKSINDTNWLVEQVQNGTINLLLRSKDNMSFGYAWNALARLASGDFLAFVCNDLEFRPGWLSQTIAGLEKYPERKLIATPYITPDKDRPNYNKEVLSDGYRINSMAGSNCFVLTPQVFKDIGEIPHHRIGGSFWYRRMVRKGYLVIVPPTDLVCHLAFRHGVDWKKPVKVEKKLLNNEIVNYDYHIEKKKYYDGKQRAAGCSIG